jgi:enoyl-CoA hydratase
VDDGVDGQDLRAFLQPLRACPVQVLRGIKAQAIAARAGADWAAHRRVEREHFIRTWLHDDHWGAADKVLSRIQR